MSFEPERLKTVGGFNNKNFGGDIFTYSPSEDVIADVLANGYFDDAYIKLNTGDFIFVNRAEGGLTILWVLEAIVEGVKVNDQYTGPPIT